VAAAAALGLGAGSGAPSARPIVFTSDWEPHFRTADVFVLGATGGRPRNLTANEVDDTDPAWAPDGRQIVFVRGGDLYVMDAAGSHVRRLTRTPAAESDPSWSPDGRRLAFARQVGRTAQIFVSDADGKQAQQVTDEEAGAEDPAWSPDGLKLAGSSGGVVFTMALDGTDVQRLPPGQSDDPGDTEPAWSPDGRTIAFSRSLWALGTSAIWIANADGTGERRLVGEASAPAWSPDGRRLAFVRWPHLVQDKDGLYTIGGPTVAVVATGGGPKRNLMPRPPKVLETFGGFRWSPDGTVYLGLQWSSRGDRLVFARRRENRPRDVFSISPRGTGMRNLTRSAAFESNPVLSPDGRRVAFVRNAISVAPTVWTANRDGSHLLRVARHATEPAWSPDGSALAFTRWDRMRTESAVVVASAEGRQRRLGAGRSPAWSPDGRLIAFAEVTRATHFWHYAVAVAAPDGSDRRILVRLRRRTVGGLAWSPDSRRLVFVDSSPGPSRRSSSWLELVSAEGGPARRLTRSPHLDEAPAWSPRGDAIAFERWTRDFNRVAVFLVFPAGGRARRLSGKWWWHDRWPSWAADGSRLVLASKRDGNYELYTIRPDGSARTRLTHNLADDAEPSW
jgi:TolB protein